MSEVIESLRAGAREFSKKQSMETDPNPRKKTDYELTQEQLADIYFSGSEKIKKSELPLVIKVIEKPRTSSAVPWIITSIAFLITAFSLFSTKRIFVDIKVLDERGPYFAALQDATDSGYPANSTARNPQTETPDQYSFQNFVFEGAAILNSSKDKTALTLVNSSVAPFARAQLHFSPPLNLTVSKIVFYAKGTRGGENLAVALKDRRNILAFDKGKIYPFPGRLTTDWQKAEISVSDVVQEFDVKNVASLRLEFGSKDTKNKPGSTVLIKDFQIVSQ